MYEGSYYHTAFELQKGLGVGWTMQAINEETITKAVSYTHLMTWWNRPGFEVYDGIICDGSIRSGKTVAMTAGFIMWAIVELDAAKPCSPDLRRALCRIVVDYQRADNYVHALIVRGYRAEIEP